jgi:hypothetical protein
VFPADAIDPLAESPIGCIGLGARFGYISGI